MITHTYRYRNHRQRWIVCHEVDSHEKRETFYSAESAEKRKDYLNRTYRERKGSTAWIEIEG